ncbi:PIN domain-containing protein [Aliterella atlantica]|uniref:DUF4935 domain-containing protein n=1 Tax=Aliterella atlantica CENA595 TaxID=1618023 RepID=A0A0D8ZPF6_9CYAN|nr:PIN domain-containing protein [Aliterella atlantica]KJH70217.1 hypothetical protein UH38_19345 [Aliterella atlantica CENA595]
MSIAKGRDLQAQEILLNIPNSIHLVVPSICYVEALLTLEKEEQYSQRFIQDIDTKISEAIRDETSAYAESLRTSLEQTRIKFIQQLNSVQERFYEAFEQLYNKAEIINIDKSILDDTLEKNVLEKDLIDRLILNYIVHHARFHNDEMKVFLSANYKEFNKGEVKEILQIYNTRYFSNTQNFLGWLNSQLS